MLKSLLTAVMLCALLALSSAAKPMTIDQDTNMFVDSLGRERFFRGLNVVYKHAPWIPIYDHFDAELSFNEDDFKLWKSWGFNIVRLGVQWPGYEPQEGVYKKEYLETLHDMVRNASRHGIYTLLDFHQDDLAESLCGEGIPDWAVKPRELFFNKFPMPFAFAFDVNETTGTPSRADCNKINWPMYQISFSGAHAYQALYNNVDGIQDAFGRFWKAVAEEFKGEEAVIGYELINEPFAGDVWTKPWILINGWADRLNLQPMYDNLNKYIREADDEHIVFFEPITFSSSASPIGF